jgi:Uma2 family endonuclease
MAAPGLYYGVLEAFMNIQLPVHMDRASFLSWVERQEERYELVEGRVIMMAGASRRHGRIVRNLLVVLHAQLDPRELEVIADFGLDAGPETLRFPDIVVDRISAAGDDSTTAAPALLAEVLSPSTSSIELGDKPGEYLRLPSLAAYLVFSQDGPEAWVWTRAERGFPPAPTIVKGYNQIIHVPSLKLSLPLKAVYAGVEPE